MYFVGIIIISQFNKIFKKKAFIQLWAHFAFITLDEENIIVTCRIHIYSMEALRSTITMRQARRRGFRKR